MISVCIATYNGENFIREQLDSIIKQLGEKDEIIISDDGSTDRTIEIIESYNDKRIRIFKSNYKNVIFNFENAINKARGDIIFLADQDDIWYDNKVQILLKEIENCDLVFSNVSIFKDDKKIHAPLYKIDKNCNGFVRNFIKNNCIGATMVFRKKVLKIVLPFPKQIPMHDMWIFFLISIRGKTKYYNRPLIYYRRHENNVSNTGEKTTNSILKIIEIRITMIVLLLVRILKKSVNK